MYKKKGHNGSFKLQDMFFQYTNRSIMLTMGEVDLESRQANATIRVEVDQYLISFKIVKAKPRSRDCVLDVIENLPLQTRRIILQKLVHQRKQLLGLRIRPKPRPPHHHRRRLLRRLPRRRRDSRHREVPSIDGLPQRALDPVEVPTPVDPPAVGVGDEELLHEVLPFELDAGALDPQAKDLENPGDDLQEADPVARPDHEASGVRIVGRRVEDCDERAVRDGDGVILSRAADAAAGIGEARRRGRSGAGRGKDAGPVWWNVEKGKKGRSGDGEHCREMAAVVGDDDRSRVRCV